MKKRITDNLIKQYHSGYYHQIKKWPVNPLNRVMKYIEKSHKSSKIADMGCGEAAISKKIKNVQSFDFFPINNKIIKADIDCVRLENGSVDVAVYCLSMLKTNVFF